jgi:poly(3-hydroxybutyrate) depolymerase
MKAIAAATLCLTITQVQAAESLRRYNIDITSTTVSGLSSGAFMAQQFHFAESDIVNGAAIIAGGPFYCAKGSLKLATDKCMQPNIAGGPSAAESLEAAQRAERKGLIPPLANIENDKVYIFTGTMDTTVNPVASAATRLLYTNLGVKADNLMYVDTVPAGHSYWTMAIPALSPPVPTSLTAIATKPATSWNS